MWPQDIVFGPVAFNGYGLMVALGVLGALALLRLTAPPAGTSFHQAFNLAFWLILAGLAGARVAFVIAHPGSFIARPGRILMYWEGGLMFQGGLAAGLTLLVVLAFKGRQSLPVMGDALAPALALGQGVGRAGCLLAGCCYGRLAPGWAGLVFPPGSQAPRGVPLYPTQAMESAVLLILALGLVISLRRHPSSAKAFDPLRPRPPDTGETKAATGAKPGRILSLYLIWSGLIRLVMEFFRGDDRGPRLIAGLRPTGLAALFILTLGLAAWLWLHPPPRGNRSARGRRPF